jgi:hypothetical protein
MGETVYVEPPRLFGPKSGKDLVILLLKSLCGIKQVPRIFYEKICEGLLEIVFVQSDIDPRLFMKSGCICVIYVDDTLFSGPDEPLKLHVWELAAMRISTHYNCKMKVKWVISWEYTFKSKARVNFF